MFGDASDPYIDYQYGLTGTFALLLGAVGLPPLWNVKLVKVE